MKLLTAKEAAQYLRISLLTLGRIDKEGLLVPFRTPGGHRRYSMEMLNEYLERGRARAPRHERRILVIDDRDEMADLLARIFSSYRFCRASDALSTGMKLAEFKPDLVLVNTRLSGVDGLDLCQRLEEQGSQTKVLPFAASREEERGEHGIGSNPLNLDALQQKIEHLFRE